MNPDVYRIGYRRRGDEVHDFKNDGRDFQYWNLDIQKELRQFKEEKQKTMYNQKLVGIEMKENLSSTMYVVSEDEPIKTNYEMEVPTYFEAERTEPATVDYEKYDFTDNREVVGDYPDAEPVVIVPQLENAEQSESYLNNAPVIDVVSDAEESEMPASIDGLGATTSVDSDRKSESVIRRSDGHDSRVRIPLTYSEYWFMTYSDKAKALGVAEDMSVNDIVKVIRDFYDNSGHGYDFDGLRDEADMIFKAARSDVVHEAAGKTTQVKKCFMRLTRICRLKGRLRCLILEWTMQIII